MPCRSDARTVVAATLLAALVAGGAARAEDGLRLALPLACTLGTDCFVQNFVDDDPGPGAADFACGPHSYDGHRGIDIRLPTTAAMRRGVPVLAAAAGRVLRVRDGMPDISIRAAAAPDVSGRECGNGIVIDHGNGWHTQYCHLKRGSVAVRPGERVAAGAAIAAVGLSGRTEFPHVHLDVTRDGQLVDPMTGAAPAAGCGIARHSLFAPALDAALAGQRVTMINAGFAAGAVTMDAVEAGTAGLQRPSATMPALVFFARVIWLKAGDRMAIRIEDPSGRTFLDTVADPVDRDKAQMMRFGGRKRPPGGWQSGLWRARFRVLRDGKAILSEERTLAMP